MQASGLSTRPVGIIRVYACGGGGINIAKEFIQAGHTADVADIRVALVDTSDSNMEDSLLDHSWLFDDTDGAGAIRTNIDKVVAKAVPSILRKFTPGDLNIVVFTLSGGTGSVAGPLLMEALLKDGQNVVGVVIGSRQSWRHAKNTISTVKTLDRICRVTERPVVLHIGMNDGLADAAADREATLVISSLCMLSSRRNHGLDTADVTSLLNFHHSTSTPPQLARLHIFSEADAYDKVMDKGGISSAFLLRDRNEVTPTAFTPYNTFGVITPLIKSNHSLYFGIENGTLPDLLKYMDTLASELESQKRTASKAVSFFSDDDTITESGIVDD